MIAKQIPFVFGNRELPLPIAPGFPVEILYQHFSSYSYDYIDWHWHEELQYCVVLNGSIIFRVGKQEYNIAAGDGIFINSQQVHMSIPAQLDSAFLCIDFHPDLLSGTKSSFLYKTYFAPVLHNANVPSLLLLQSTAEQREVLKTIKKIRTLFDEQKSGFELDIFAVLIELWKETLLCLPGITDNQENDQQENLRLQDIFSYINEFYAEPLTLQGIANHVHLSRSECCRFFHKITGQSLFNYITLFRIGKSLELLLQTKKSIAEIAFAVGFNSQSYYTGCFRKLRNITPRQFRSNFLCNENQDDLNNLTETDAHTSTEKEKSP